MNSSLVKAALTYPKAFGFKDRRPLKTRHLQAENPLHSSYDSIFFHPRISQKASIFNVDDVLRNLILRIGHPF